MRAPSSTWMDAVKALGVETVARAFGVAVATKGRGGIACPACGEAKRGSADHRAACGLTRDGAGWKCHRCQVKGTALDVAVHRTLGRTASGAADWVRVRDACASAGLCDAPGVTPRVAPPPAPPPTPRDEGPHDGAWLPGDAWRTWESHAERGEEGDQVRAWLTSQRGFPSTARVESGAVLATLATLDAWPEHARGWVRDRLTRSGPALLAPMRNARTNVVEGLALRFLDANAKPKCVTVAGLRHTSADGTARGYGWAGACRRTGLVVLVEGLTDTLAAEALLDGRADAVAVGAIAADSLRHWSGVLAERSHGHVVVVPDLDRPKGVALPTADGKGQHVATALVSTLRAAGVAASIFKPGAWLKRLRASGLDVADALPRIKDVADVVRECAAANIPWETLRAAFHDTLDEVTRG